MTESRAQTTEEIVEALAGLRVLAYVAQRTEPPGRGVDIGTRLADALAAARGEAIAEPADLQSWAQEVERAAVNRALDAVNLHAMNGDTLAMMRARDAIRAEFGDTP